MRNKMDTFAIWRITGRHKKPLKSALTCTGLKKSFFGDRFSSDLVQVKIKTKVEYPNGLDDSSLFPDNSTYRANTIVELKAHDPFFAKPVFETLEASMEDLSKRTGVFCHTTFTPKRLESSTDLQRKIEGLVTNGLGYHDNRFAVQEFPARGDYNSAIIRYL